MKRLAIVLVVVAACRVSHERAPRDFERMRTQQRYAPYGPSRFFANGAAMQAPPPHTVVRDDAPAALSGRVQYVVSCEPCHGAGGFGGGTVASNLTEKRPASLQSALVTAMSDSQLFDVITNGFGRMPPYGWQLPPASRRVVIAYVHSLRALPRDSAMLRDSARAEAMRQLDSLRQLGNGDVGRDTRGQP